MSIDNYIIYLKWYIKFHFKLYVVYIIKLRIYENHKNFWRAF